MKHSGTAFLDPAFNKYGYNSRSEVVSGDRYWGTDIEDTSDPVGLQSSAYSYDNIGNRLSVTSASSVVTYTPNALNQYTQRTVPGTINILGSATTNATVTVSASGGSAGGGNNQPVNREQEYWYKQLTVTNSAEAQYPLITVMGVYNPPDTNDPDVVTVESGKVFVAKTPETFTYDDDGNLLSDGRFNYTWDCENRLIQAETSTNLPSSVPVILCYFSYDYMGRRISKQVYSWSTNDWQLTTDNTFLYDGWNLISEVVRTVPGEPVHTIEGQININPNNSADNEFTLTLADGTTITRDDLTKDFAGYSGEATGIHIKPKGNSSQDGLTVDGEVYPLENNNAYDIASASMTVNLYNDNVNKNGKAMGHWWISIAATDATISVGDNSDTPTPPYSFTSYYVWGLDLSGSLQGAGGIGGLLAAVRSDPEPVEWVYCYDANGNVGQLIDADDGSIAAHYEYSPFGETIVSSGSLADSFTHRFSTKYTDDESGLLYYGYRYYSPSLGRWPSRDPIFEAGGQVLRSSGRVAVIPGWSSVVGDEGLYRFVGNAPPNLVDRLGMDLKVEVTLDNYHGTVEVFNPGINYYIKQPPDEPGYYSKPGAIIWSHLTPNPSGVTVSMMGSISAADIPFSNVTDIRLSGYVIATMTVSGCCCAGANTASIEWTLRAGVSAVGLGCSGKAKFGDDSVLANVRSTPNSGYGSEIRLIPDDGQLSYTAGVYVEISIVSGDASATATVIASAICGSCEGS